MLACIHEPALGYWAGLASSINFPGKTLKACLDVIHLDIINVWNIEDPYGVRSDSSSVLLRPFDPFF